MGFDIFEWYNNMNKGDIILAFKGNISSDLITDVLEIIESKLFYSKENPKISKKIYNVLVECLQNLYHHSEPSPNANIEIDNNFGIFILSKIQDNSYRISTGNFVKNEKIDLLANKIDKLNSLSNEELKSLYKLILNNQDFTEKGGGGLGMIDIARKTGNKINYEFYNYTNNLSFFNLNIIIS